MEQFVDVDALLKIDESCASESKDRQTTSRCNERRLVRDSGSREALMIGDRGEDIRAANINGIPSIAVRWGYGSEAELAEAGPSYSAHTMQDIVRWIEMRAAR